MKSLRRSRVRHLVVPLIVAMIAASCGGGDDESVAEEDPATEETGTTEPSGGEESSVPAEESDEPATEESSSVGPVVETLPPETLPPEPVAGGTLRVGILAEAGGLNPAISSFSAVGYMMANAVFDNLAVYAADGTVIPYLAESFTPSDDFQSWQIKVREGITFHDGEPLNADALMANVTAQLTGPLVGIAVRVFLPTEGAVEKIDDMTIQVNLLQPSAYFPSVLTNQLGMVASPKWLAAAAVDPTLNQEPVGTGPFVFDSRTEDSVTRFVRNETWWGGDVLLDAVELYPVEDGASRADLFFGGELDVIQTTDQADILDLRDDETVQHLFDDSGEESFAMLNTASPPFDDIRARQALTFATPVQNYVDLIGLGVARAANSRFIPESPFSNPDVVQEGDDPGKALSLATEYCADKGDAVNTVTGQSTCTNGKINIEFQYSGPSVVQDRIAEILNEGWSEAFNVTFDVILEDEHINQTAFGQYNVNTWRQFGAEDPYYDNLWLGCSSIGGISLNWPRYCDEERDAVLLAAQLEPDATARAALYQQAEQMIHDAYTYIYFIHSTWEIGLQENVHGACSKLSPEGVLMKCAVIGRIWFDTIWLD